MNESEKPETRETLCRELAEMLARPDGLRLTRYLQMTGILEPPAWEVLPSKEKKPDAEPRPISIWSPRGRGADQVFVRPAPGPFGDHYATREILHVRKEKGKRRICFFGESVAAGYLYAPHLTPAMVLQDQLASLRGSKAFEVVDLARTNETMDGLLQTAEASLQLQPDGWVFLMGNNWDLLENPALSPWLPSVRNRQAYARALREMDWFGPMELGARQLFEKAGRTLTTIEKLAKSASIHVTLVVPEVNLAHWENRQPIGWLANGQTSHWHRLYGEARSRLAKDEWSEALTAAREMARLDEGSHPTTYRIMALALAGLGRRKEAREACRREVDASHYATMAFLGAPRAGSMVQELQRRAARFHGFALVDLPKIFAELAGPHPPGRELFLDYCHLTLRGMKLAMAAVCTELLRHFDERKGGPGVRDLLARLPRLVVPAEVDATAKLGAAIHTAHRHLPLSDKSTLIEYWCRAALAASAGIAEAMADLVAARGAPGPAVLTAAQQRNYRSPYRLMLQHGWKWDFLDAELLQTLFKLLKERGRLGELETALVKYRGARPEGTELLPFYLWEPLERLYPEVMATTDLNGRAGHRAFWPETAFAIVCGRGLDIELELVCRMPPRGVFSSTSLTLEVNGTSLTDLELSHIWQKIRFRIEARFLKNGINRLVFLWPPLAEEDGKAQRRALKRLELGLEADLFPVFGEIFRLTARTVDGTSLSPADV